MTRASATTQGAPAARPASRACSATARAGPGSWSASSARARVARAAERSSLGGSAGSAVDRGRARRPRPPRPRPGRAGSTASRSLARLRSTGSESAAQVAEQAAQLVRGPAQVAGVGRGQGRPQGQVAALDAAELLRLADPLPQRQGQVVVPVRLGRRGQPLGLLAGLHRRGERAGDVVAGQAVVGQLGRGAGHLGQAPLVGQQLGQQPVQPGPLPRQQVGVDGLAQQRVPERQAVAAVGDQQPLGDGLADGILVLRGRPARRPA